MLLYLRDVRITERWIAGILELPEPRQMVNKSVSIKLTMSRSLVHDIQASPKMAKTGMQAVPRTSEKDSSTQPSSVYGGGCHACCVDRVVDAVSSAVKVGGAVLTSLGT
jgi:hypothetical protein